MATLLVVAMLFRALYPVGYMPDVEQKAAGIFSIKICTAYGYEYMPVGPDGQPADKKGEHKQSSISHRPYSISSQDIIVSSAPLKIDFVFYGTRYQPIFEIACADVSPEGLAQPRGPPVTATV